MQLDNILELNDDVYYVDVYDFDDVNQAPHDFLGSIEFVGRSNTKTYYSQYNDTQLFGTLSVTVDMFVDYY